MGVHSLPSLSSWRRVASVQASSLGPTPPLFPCPYDSPMASLGLYYPLSLSLSPSSADTLRVPSSIMVMWPLPSTSTLTPHIHQLTGDLGSCLSTFGVPPKVSNDLGFFLHVRIYFILISSISRFPTPLTFPRSLSHHPPFNFISVYIWIFPLNSISVVCIHMV